jgi:hypothetical protein
VNKNEAIEVWEFAHHFWPPRSRFKLFAVRGPKEHFGFTLTKPRDLEVMTEWTDNHGYNAYWQINPTARFGGTRCSTRDITHWCFLPLDIDPVSDPAIPIFAFWAFEDRLSTVLPELDVSARTIIDSGRGIQGLYAVRAHALSPSERVSIPRWMSRLFNNFVGATRNGCVLDTSCSDLPRVMRLPYTINTKSGFVAKSLGYALEAPPDVALIQTKTPDPIPLGLAHWVEYLSEITVTARRFIEQGTGRGGRHKAATAAMLSLEEHGASYETIASALRRGAAMSEPPLPISEVENMVRRRVAKRLTRAS